MTTQKRQAEDTPKVYQQKYLTIVTESQSKYFRTSVPHYGQTPCLGRDVMLMQVVGLGNVKANASNI